MQELLISSFLKLRHGMQDRTHHISVWTCYLEIKPNTYTKNKSPQWWTHRQHLLQQLCSKIKQTWRVQHETAKWQCFFLLLF